MIVARVMRAVTGAASKLFFAAGARLRPISPTMAPVTIGGIRRLIHPAPNFCTIAPMIASPTPASTTPPSAPATAVLLLRGHDRRDEREAGPEVARHLAPGDHQEQQRADAGEEERGGRRHSGDDRDQEGGAEHGDNVLHSDADGQRPRQALIRLHDLARADGLAVAVELPFGTEHAHCRGPFRECVAGREGIFRSNFTAPVFPACVAGGAAVPDVTGRYGKQEAQVEVATIDRNQWPPPPAGTPSERDAHDHRP